MRRLIVLWVVTLVLTGCSGRGRASSSTPTVTQTMTPTAVVTNTATTGVAATAIATVTPIILSSQTFAVTPESQAPEPTATLTGPFTCQEVMGQACYGDPKIDHCTADIADPNLMCFFTSDLEIHTLPNCLNVNGYRAIDYGVRNITTSDLDVEVELVPSVDTPQSERGVQIWSDFLKAGAVTIGNTRQKNSGVLRFWTADYTVLETEVPFNPPMC